jgi:uncharacterized phage protein gp47/JayE
MKVKSWRTILEEMVTDARNESSAITDWNVGTPQRALLHSVANQLQQLWVRLKRVYRASKILTAMSDDLDDQVIARGLTRYAAAKAGVSLRFYGSAGSNVPADTRVSTKDGISFSTVEGGTIGTGETYVDLDAEADVAGSGGNVGANMITELSGTLPGITGVTNLYPATGGVDSETDEELRNRAMTQLATISQGIQASYQAWAQEANSEVLRAKAERVDASPGTVYVHLVKRSGAGFTLQERNEIADYIRTKAPISSNIVCKNAVFHEIQVSAEIRLETGYSLAEVKQTIVENLTVYLDWRTWNWGQEVQSADLMSVVNNSEGVNDLIVSRFTPADNVVLGDYELPKPGYVVVTETLAANPQGGQSGGGGAT